MAKPILLFLFAAAASCALCAEEETFNATEFVLRDGRQLMAVCDSAAQNANSIVTLDGQRLNLRADEISNQSGQATPPFRHCRQTFATRWPETARLRRYQSAPRCKR